MNTVPTKRKQMHFTSKKKIDQFFYSRFSSSNRCHDKFRIKITFRLESDGLFISFIRLCAFFVSITKLNISRNFDHTQRSLALRFYFIFRSAICSAFHFCMPHQTGARRPSRAHKFNYNSILQEK